MATQNRSELLSMTVKELHVIAEALELKGYKKHKKDDLVSAILDASKKESIASEKQEKTATAVAASTKSPSKEKEVDAPKASKAKPSTSEKVSADSVDENTTKPLAGAKKAAQVKTSSTKEQKSETAIAKTKKSETAIAKTEKSETAIAKTKKSETAIAKVSKSQTAIAKTVKTKAKAKDSALEDLALLETESALAASQLAEIKEEEHKEPTSIFIDKGMLLPQFVPGTRLRALVRDPGTTFVYWDSEFESPEGWQVSAYNAKGDLLESFRSSARRAGSGYFHAPSMSIARVSLAVIRHGSIAETALESRLSLREQIKTPSSLETWIDVESRELVYEAPAPGRAPSTEVYDSNLEDGSDQGHSAGMRNAPSSWMKGIGISSSSDDLVRRK